MNTYVAYDKKSFRILGFIRNDYTSLEEAKDVFENFENHEVAKTLLELPYSFSNYKAIIKNDEIIAFEVDE